MLAAALVAAGSLTLAPPASAAAETIAVDFADSTGALHGGAAGYLYGLGDPGVPTTSVVAGAGVKHVTQMPEGGLQHPNGGALTNAPDFFRSGGEEIYINIQDDYAQWPYNGNTHPGQAAYLEVVEKVVQRVADATDPDDYDRYVFTPFNEPDWIWYGNWAATRAQFLSDWEASYHLIQEIMPGVRVAGIGLAGWNAQRMQDWLTFARDRNVLPDIVTWHELDDPDLRDFPAHLAQYRGIEDSLGIDDIPININEYAGQRDTGVPGRMIQWLSMFEGAKVDAQVAYWSQSGNLDDHVAEVNGGNGAWWLLKWYADLTGDTVRLTPPVAHQPGTLQGIATSDEDAQIATVLLGGGSTDVQLDFTGLDAAVFGTEVDLQVQRTQFSGQEGFAEQPPVIQSERITLDGDGGGSVTVPNSDRMDAYRVLITPARGAAPLVDAAWQIRTEAEATALAGGATVTTLAANAQATSGQADVRGFTNAGASATWTVEVPRDGTYLLGIQYGTNDRPDGTNMKSGRHALFVDGAFGQIVQYTSTLRVTYKGRVEVPVELTAGTHTLSLRAGQDGVTALPGSNIALDRFDLTEATAPESASYPGPLARLSGDTTVTWGDGPFGGDVRFGADGEAAFYLGAADDGYYDVTLEYTTDGAQDLSVALNGRTIDGVAATAAGTWQSTLTVHAAKGIQELTVAGEGVRVRGVSVVRNDVADENVTTIQAEDASVVKSAGVTIENPATSYATYGSNAQGQFVGWLSAGRTLTIPRPATADAGQYNFLVHFANATRNTSHPYNTDGISRQADITEVGGETTATGYFRYNYSYYNFWWQNVPLDLVTDDGAIVVGNPRGDAPNIDAFQLAPLVVALTNEPLDEVEIPAVSAAVAPAEPDGLDGWYVTAPAVTVSADDPGADIEYRVGGGEWTVYSGPVTLDEDGTHTVEYRATNEAGTSEVGTVEVAVDLTAPETAATLDGELDSDVYLGPATLTLATSDVASGVVETQYRLAGGAEHTVYSGPVTLDPATVYEVEYRSVDAAGNVGDWQQLTIAVAETMVIVGGVDSGVANRTVSSRVTINDLILDEQPWSSRGAFHRHVTEVTGQLRADGVITAREASSIQRAATQSDVGRSGPRVPLE
ncbi:OmpL47-type beta-barrel domain-containing protein [Jiangella endophytica]|uniref:OmpL47-type beta-barrel domain-containing protein n=1 Tax=Jiangella endophytica TaxID=1623398 RepID=UPI000E354A43|nr:hypothetical protein [Jiangella endophytica]